MNNKTKGIILTLFASLLIGSCAVIQKIMLAYTNVETINFLWFASASIMFMLLLLAMRQINKLKVIIKNYKKLSLLGASVAIGTILWTYGILFTNPTNVAFLTQFSLVFAIVMGVMFLKERFFLLEGIGMVISIIGVIVMTYEYGEVALISTFTVLLAALFFALSNFLAKVYVRNIDVITLTAGRSFFVFIFISTYVLFTSKFIFLNIFTLLPLAFLGSFFGAFLGFLIFYKALSLFEISKAIVVRCSEPLFTAVLSVIFLNLIPTINQIVGGCLIILGIILLSVRRGIKDAESIEM